MGDECSSEAHRRIHQNPLENPREGELINEWTEIDLYLIFLLSKISSSCIIDEKKFRNL